jgi:hypothetical protein
MEWSRMRDRRIKVEINMGFVQTCLGGSRTLSQKKDDITLFIRIFLQPLEGVIVELYGKFKVLDEISINDSVTAQINTHKTGVVLWFRETSVGRKFLFSLREKESTPPSDYTADLWSALPIILEKLIKLVPKLQETADFYFNAAK